PDYPERLALITRRALARDPRERFESADALRAALEQYLVEERIVVSQGSVAKLVERVLGERIEALRLSVERACVDRDLNEEDTGTPRPASLEAKAPASARSLLPPLLSAIGGIGAAVGSILWVTQHRPGSSDLIPNTRASESVKSAGAQSSPFTEPSPAGV